MESSVPSAFSTLLSEIPKGKWWGCFDINNWEGFWYLSSHLDGAISARKNFQATDDDVILASSMKTGTTWLKAIIPTIMNPNGRRRNDDDTDHDPLLKHHPNGLMPNLEVHIFKENPNPDLSATPSPRLFRTHVPYSMLPESAKNSACKIVYITRDPKDTFVSLWHFINSWVSSMGKPPCPMDEAFDSFCKGVHPFGPFPDHVLTYWKESLKRPEKILFLRYEDIKKDPKVELKKLASFLGRPFANEEEVENVIWRCSLERLKNLEVNQNGVDPWVGIPYRFYFRRGKVGDWQGNFTQAMKERLDQVTAFKFEGSGLYFGDNIHI